ncbi:MFS transporter [Kitasatospora sp. NBC_01287]|uniref:MFS transporter n=1 Tax=Kitasatospora sp. NBC_01287 TaxID=2903573 RepID=UPI00225429EB|nr:MFS transporter [Kitasatospora sp. NBC_01287]MCX4749975.1 MFS transporter [Kitasatospora sp. NBC_01287]
MLERISAPRLSRALPPAGPQRAMVLSSFVNRVGNGLFNNASVLYFTRVVHLPAGQIGLGLSIAGLIGLLAGVPAGELADRRGPRAVVLLTLAVQTATMVAFLFVHSWAAFTAIATLDLLALSANNAARGALIARIGGERPAEFRARLRTFVNVGVVLGTSGAAVAVQLDTRAAYAALILLNAASYLGCGLLLLRVPSCPPLPRPAAEGRWTALRDKPFALIAAVDGAMGLQYPVASLLLPLWLAQHTPVPRWTVAAVAALNSLCCVAFQIPIGSRVRTPGDGGLALRHAGLLFLLSCPLMALTADLPPWEAVLLVVPAMAAHSLGEVWQSSGNFALGFGLAPEHAQGQYQGLLGLSFDIGQALAPALLTTVCLGLGQLGWLLLGVFFALLGLLGPPLAAWAVRTRPGGAGALAGAAAGG